MISSSVKTPPSPKRWVAALSRGTSTKTAQIPIRQSKASIIYYDFHATESELSGNILANQMARMTTEALKGYNVRKAFWTWAFYIRSPKHKNRNKTNDNSSRNFTHTLSGFSTSEYVFGFGLFFGLPSSSSIGISTSLLLPFSRALISKHQVQRWNNNKNNKTTLL